MIFVVGSGLLAYVTAASLARDGHIVTQLHAYGTSGLDEPGLDELVDRMTAEGKLVNAFDKSPEHAEDDILWICYDTPVDALGEANLDWLQERIELLLNEAVPGMTIVISSQVPAGFCSDLQQVEPDFKFVAAPENIRRGSALVDFWAGPPVLGTHPTLDRERLGNLTELLSNHGEIMWMSAESAEFSKHIINAFVASCIAFADEMGSYAVAFDADYDDALRAAKRDPRLAGRVPLRPGMADGRHLLRDVRYLLESDESAFFQSVLESQAWET